MSGLGTLRTPSPFNPTSSQGERPISSETLTIGEVARQVELNASAIRYYERIGLMPPATRVSGQRRYGADTVQRLQLLKAAKRLGFTLEETQLLLAAEADGMPADQMRALAQRKLSEVDALIEQLMQVRRLLQGAAQCRAEQLCNCTVLAETVPLDHPVRIRKS